MYAIISANGIKYLVFSESDDLCMLYVTKISYAMRIYIYTIYNNRTAQTRDKRRRAHVYIHLNSCEKFIWIFLLISMCCTGLFIYHFVCVLCIHMRKFSGISNLASSRSLCTNFHNVRTKKRKKNTEEEEEEEEKNENKIIRAPSTMVL